MRRIRLLFGLALVGSLPAWAAAESLTAKQVIDRIEQHAGGPWHGDTVDTIKAGDPETKVTGIATCFSATYDELKRAVAAGVNLIVAHEPTFYSHLDDTKPLVNDPVYLAKLAYINEHHLVVFRFHDHWHYPVMNPDGILQGMVNALGWRKYQDAGHPLLFAVPETTVEKLAADIQDRLKIRTLRVVGDPRMSVRSVAFLPGAAGSEAHIQALERPGTDVLIVGEAREWETVEYVRDAASEHQHKAMIQLGHVVSEEAGMEYCAEWLGKFLPGMPIKFIPSKEPFWRPGAAPNSSGE